VRTRVAAARGRETDRVRTVMEDRERYRVRVGTTRFPERCVGWRGGFNDVTYRTNARGARRRKPKGGKGLESFKRIRVPARASRSIARKFSARKYQSPARVYTREKTVEYGFTFRNRRRACFSQKNNDTYHTDSTALSRVARPVIVINVHRWISHAFVVCFSFFECTRRPIAEFVWLTLFGKIDVFPFESNTVRSRT